MRKSVANFVLAYLKFFAKLCLLLNRPLIIGIAGSAGKSSTRNAIYAILSKHDKTKFIYGNSETGIPLGILGLDITNYSALNWILILLSAPFKLFSMKGYKYAVVEMGIDGPYPPKNMEYILSIVKPDIAISLNISATHTMQFEELLPSKDANESNHDFLLRKIAEEDTKIISKSDCKVGIYNADDPYITNALSNYKGRSISFGSKKGLSISYGYYHPSLKGTEFEVTIDQEAYKITIAGHILPEVFKEVFSASILAAKELGISYEESIKALEERFHLPKGRSSIFEGISNSIIIDSSYNSSKNSVLSFLELLSQLKKDSKREIIFLMGDMRELGGEAKPEHEEIAKAINKVVDKAFFVGPLTKDYVVPLVDKKINPLWFETSSEAGMKLSESLSDKSIILVKGSQNNILLEEAIKPLLKSKADYKKLCRQDDYWINLKNKKGLLFQG